MERVALKGQISPHTARKIYAVSLYHEKGINAVQRELAHDSIGTTMLYALSDRLKLEKNGEEFNVTFDSDKLVDLIVEKLIERLRKLNLIKGLTK